MQALSEEIFTLNCIYPKKFIYPLLLPSHNCINNYNVQFSRYIMSFQETQWSFSFEELQSISWKKKWWAKMDSNHRPHDYQSCALASWAIGPYPYFFWWRVPGSNRWPPACKAGALPAELNPHIQLLKSGGPKWTRTIDLTIISRVL